MMMEYYIDKYGIEDAAVEYYPKQDDPEFKALLREYRNAHKLLKLYMIETSGLEELE
jgi:sulfur relay (sulfurtransferase) DsrF/TusC family protein